ncbi:hypothetical protein DICPUDRAFT_77930 [Dictyostelium purpureum]|uniref:Uncharacterized protein n=1 Tax=Dictyostelium purpureum TaxID=5786 RepID=F0ZI22_DICPU|nr:uncharacterized protein DICPUDRAFT_77930 [Dictyostelium purpureum]EGC36436.1 hypothetical protein DICPUDRAFT_77930 [Dictyostelium purpureum]|eukprot:XP_003287069.1 hypothetical protein DICPUDRAFT_77930 [Dictyostelium purpureum]
MDIKKFKIQKIDFSKCGQKYNGFQSNCYPREIFEHFLSLNQFECTIEKINQCIIRYTKSIRTLNFTFLIIFIISFIGVMIGFCKFKILLFICSITSLLIIILIISLNVIIEKNHKKLLNNIVNEFNTTYENQFIKLEIIRNKKKGCYKANIYYPTLEKQTQVKMYNINEKTITNDKTAQKPDPINNPNHELLINKIINNITIDN